MTTKLWWQLINAPLVSIVQSDLFFSLDGLCLTSISTVHVHIVSFLNSLCGRRKAWRRNSGSSCFMVIPASKMLHVKMSHSPSPSPVLLFPHQLVLLSNMKSTVFLLLLTELQRQGHVTISKPPSRCQGLLHGILEDKSEGKILPGSLPILSYLKASSGSSSKNRSCCFSF
jgi:hypothetical protein